MGDRQARDGPGPAAERALAAALKAQAAARRPPEPPAALRDIAWSATLDSAAGAAKRTRRGARSAGEGRAGRPSVAADLAWAAALAACLACAMAFGRVETGLARSLDDPAIAGTIRAALSPSALGSLLKRIDIDTSAP